MGFTDTSLVWRTAFFITFLGFVLTLGGLSSTYMADTELIPNMWMHIGMWDICDDTKSFSCQSVEQFLVGTDDSTAILCSIGGVIFIVFGLDLLERTVEMYSQPSWSFIIYMLGQFCALCAAAMNFYDACRDDMD